MSRPEDPIQDEIEHPEQTWQLQQSYPLSQADQQSLLRIRTRLLAQPSASHSPEAKPLQAPFNETPGRPRAGQFLPSHVLQPFRPKKKAVSAWGLVALVVIVVLSVVVLRGMWYGYTLGHTMGGLRVTPTGVPGQNAASAISDLKMTSTTTGWALMPLQSSGQLRFTIGRTTDGGKSWQSFDFQAYSFGHVFLDDQTAWVTMDHDLNAQTSVTVKHTVDGGRHWTTQQLPSGMDHMVFVDRQHGWTWGGFLPYASPNTVLYKTIDGGITWTTPGILSTPRASDDPTPGALPLGDILDLNFLTPQRGWAVISPKPHVGQVQAVLYMTQDGGQTWQIQKLPQPANGSIPGIHLTLGGTSATFLSVEGPKFFDSHHGVLRIASQISTNTQGPLDFYLYETSDDGQSWSLLGNSIERPTARSFATFALDPTRLLLADDKTITLYVFVDGQWQTQKIQNIGGIRCLSFIDDLHGWACASQPAGNQQVNTLYTTSDGGKSWHKIMQNRQPNFQIHTQSSEYKK